MRFKAAWVDLLTGIGVILSLIFVGVQIRENTRAVRGSTVQGITDQSLDLNSLLVSVPELRGGFSKAMSGNTADITPEEEDALTSWYGSLLRVSENRFRQRQLGTFAGDLAAAGGRASAYRIPFFKAYWDRRRDMYAPDFAAFVDSALIPLVRDSVPRVLPR